MVPPVELDRPVRVATISNPQSGNNRRRNHIRSALDILGRSRVPHYEVDNLDSIAAITQKLIDDGIELIVINGGDGTVQGVLTGLFRTPPAPTQPLLAVLPGGSTNTTARNVGYAPSALPALQELLSQAARGRLTGTLEPRAVIRVDRGPNSLPLFAMFFGAGAVYHGIRFAKDHIESRGLRGPLAAGAALVVFMGKITSGKGGALFPPLRAGGRLDQEPLETDSYLGLITSTMEQQFLGLRPYWGQGSGPLQYSSLSYSPRHLLRAVSAIIRGRISRYVRPEFGYRSHNVHAIELNLDSGFTLDGELFPFEPETTLRLTCEHSAFFLRQHPR